MSDYLFEKTGDDPEIERLEKVLRPLAYRGAAPQLPRRRRPVWIPALVVTAAAAAIALAVWAVRPRPPAVEWTEGPRTLQVTNIGTVVLDEQTRARFLEPEKLELDHGHLTARIAAPPRRFSVKTRYMTVIDLGCAFELTVDSEGRGKLVVTEGKVALVDGNREVVVPAGAECTLDDNGPGTPSLPHVSAPQPVEAVKPVPKLVAKKPVIQKPIQKKSEPVPPKKAPSEPAPINPLKKKTNDSRFDHNTLDDLENSAR